MKKQHIALILALLAPASLWAGSNEQAYIDSYKGSSRKPAPIEVVTPDTQGHWAGKSLELTFVVDNEGKPKRIISRSPVDRALVRQVIDAVSRWRFEPKLDKNGNPVPARVKLVVEIKRAGERSAPLYAGIKQARRDYWKRK